MQPSHDFSPGGDLLPPVEDRTASVRAAQFAAAGLRGWERDVFSGEPSRLAALAAVPGVAAAIDGDLASATFGWQASRAYRWKEGEVHAGPHNARLMEPVHLLVWAYTLNEPYNPYFHDAALKQRLEAGLHYWMGLQGSNGGFPEYHVGGEELPPTAFDADHLFDIYLLLRADETIDERISASVLQCVLGAARWLAENKAGRRQGIGATNQYAPALLVFWRLYELTGDAQWKAIYDARLDEWLAAGQVMPYWYENSGVENFGYSDVTEWTLDRLYILNRDPRLLESLRRYYEWCGLNTLPENDGRTFLLDNLAHARTNTRQPSGQVGYYGHIATLLPEAQAFAFAYLAAPEEREQRVAQWMEHAPLPPANQTGWELPALYNPYHIALDYSPPGLWTIYEVTQSAAVRQLPPVAHSRFTRYFQSALGNDHFLFVRRPRVYATLHWGTPDGLQAKEVGLVWLPGFGMLLRSDNERAEWALCTRRGEGSTFRQPMDEVALAGANADLNKLDDALPLELAANFGDTAKTYGIDDEAFTLTVQTNEDAVEQIPLYLDDTDVLQAGGERLDFKAGPVTIEAEVFTVSRSCGGKRATASVQLSQSAAVMLREAYRVGNGAVYVLDVPVPAGGRLSYRCGLCSG